MPLISTSGSKPEYPVIVATFSQEKEMRAFSSLNLLHPLFGQCIRKRDILQTEIGTVFHKSVGYTAVLVRVSPNGAGHRVAGSFTRPAVQYGCGLVVSGCHSFVVNIVGVINLVSRYALQENGEFPALIREIIA